MRVLRTVIHTTLVQILGLTYAVVSWVVCNWVSAVTNRLPLQNFWVKDHRQIYLIGNPLVWYLSSAAVFAYIAVRGFLILRAKRGYRDFDNSECVFRL